MGGSDGGRGEPLTPHKTRRSLPSQASGKLMDKQEQREPSASGTREWEGKRFFCFFNLENEEKVFPF